jgi:hypothetical protein
MTCVLAGFRSRRTRRDEARVAGVPARALEPNPSCTLFPVSAVSSPRTRRLNTDALPRCFALMLPRDVAAARRPVARIRRTSSTVRAGVTGATGRLDDRQPCEPACFEATRASRVSRSRTIRPLERLRYPSARPSRVIRQSRPSSAWRSTTRATAAWPGRTTQVFPRSPSDGAHGVQVPFAGLLPRTGGRFPALDARHKRRG